MGVVLSELRPSFLLCGGDGAEWSGGAVTFNNNP